MQRLDVDLDAVVEVRVPAVWALVGGLPGREDAVVRAGALRAFVMALLHPLQPSVEPVRLFEPGLPFQAFVDPAVLFRQCRLAAAGVDGLAQVLRPQLGQPRVRRGLLAYGVTRVEVAASLIYHKPNYAEEL